MVKMKNKDVIDTIVKVDSDIGTYYWNTTNFAHSEYVFLKTKKVVYSCSTIVEAYGILNLSPNRVEVKSTDKKVKNLKSVDYKSKFKFKLADYPKRLKLIADSDKECLILIAVSDINFIDDYLDSGCNTKEVPATVEETNWVLSIFNNICDK